jgi:hypothetical protein
MKSWLKGEGILRDDQSGRNTAATQAARLATDALPGAPGVGIHAACYCLCKFLHRVYFVNIDKRTPGSRISDLWIWGLWSPI